MSRVLVLVRRGRHEQLVDVPARPARGEVDEDGPLDERDAVEDDDGDGDDGADDLPDDAEEVLADEPLARTLVFLVLGFVVMVAGLASVIAG